MKVTTPLRPYNGTPTMNAQPASERSYNAYFSRQAMRQPQFGATGSLAVLGQLIGLASKEVNGEQEQNRGSGFLKKLAKQIIPGVLLTLSIANVPKVVTEVRQLNNEQSGTPLTEVVVPPADSEEAPVFSEGVTREQLLTYAGSTQVELSASELIDMAKAGYLEQVISDNPAATKVIAILKDGKELPANMDQATRRTLLDDHDIEIKRPSLQWASFDWLTASAIAATMLLIANALLAMTKRTVSAVFKTEHYKENMEAQAAFNSGFYAVAKDLGVSDEPLSLSDVEAKINKLKDEMKQIPYGDVSALNHRVLTEMRDYITILLGGHLSNFLLTEKRNEREDKHDDPSALDVRARLKASDIARDMTKMGSGWNLFFDETPDAAKVKTASLELFDGEYTDAKAIIVDRIQYLENLHEGFLQFKKLKPHEAEALLSGQMTPMDIRQNRKLYRVYDTVISPPRSEEDPRATQKLKKNDDTKPSLTNGKPQPNPDARALEASDKMMDKLAMLDEPVIEEPVVTEEASEESSKKVES